MKEILLTQGKRTLIDDDDLERVAKLNWYAWYSGYDWYACSYTIREGKRVQVYLHRFILDVWDKRSIDHINRNGLDNQKLNLRACTQTENLANTPKYANNSSGYKGVSWSKGAKKWEAYVTCNKQRHYLGLFNEAEVAARVRDAKAKELLGEFAVLNFPGGS